MTGPERGREIPSRFEDEGIPDLQEGTPEQQWSRDPQEAPLPGREPAAVLDHGTTAEEQREGEPLDLRLSREEPDVVPDDIPVDADPALDADDPAFEQVGRLVAPDEGVRADDEKDEIATDVGPDAGGLTAEEAAMHVEPDRADG
jgi:hypothetical protein